MEHVHPDDQDRENFLAVLGSVVKRHNKPGHVLQGRFKANAIKKEEYLLELCRYVVLNPVRAKMLEEPEACH